MSQHLSTIGTVYLVGAGPGDPGLIALRGAECLRRADAVLYDYLLNPRLLEHARRDAEKICLGRHGRGKIMPQDEINRRMVELARAGKTVVRLKAGDPTVFARMAEELEALTAAGIPYEIVPGVTVALAAASYAQIPITHRDLASCVALVTGQEREGKSETSVDFAGLAAFPGTLVFYMGVTTAPVWTAALIAAGKPADTPAAIVRRCSWADQRTIRCTLAEVPQQIDQERLRPPVIVIVGEVVQTAPATSWFTARPLFGAKILVTRPLGQATSLIEKLEQHGAECFIQPAIEIGPPTDLLALDAVIGRLAEFDWVVFSSVNGVQYFFERLLVTKRDIRHLGRVQLAAIGPGTAAALAVYHLHADLQPAEFRAEALAVELISVMQSTPQNRRCLLVRASRGREVLAEQLTASGATVEQVVVYTSHDVQQADATIATLLSTGQFDWVTVSSSAIARSLAQMFGDDLRRSRLASISPITSATLRELGFEPAVEASEYTMDGMAAAILSAEQQ